MSYSVERASLIAKQLERLATQNMHQLAGQVANLEFWISEASEAIRVIQDYPARFRRLRDAQVGWVKAHGTKVSGYCPICQGGCEFGPTTPQPPQRTPSVELGIARQAVGAALRRYLLRCYRAELIDEGRVRKVCAELDIGLEPEDLDLRSPPDLDDESA